MEKHAYIKIVKLFLLAVIAELIMRGDAVCFWISGLFSSNVIIRSIICYPLNYIVWITGIIFICCIYKRNPDIHFKYLEKPNSKQFITAGLLLALTLLISLFSWGGFKVYKELTGSILYAGLGLGIANFIAQYFYYFLETILIIIIIACSQEAGELLFKKKFIPYGGICRH